MDQENPMQQLSDAELVRQAGYGEERLSSILVTGTLLCEVCLQPGSQLITFYIKGAKVAVACKTEAVVRRRRNCCNGTTDEYGEFIIDLPSQLHATPNLEEACVVRVLRMPRNTLCRHLAGVNPRRIKLSSVGNSVREYTAGIVRTGVRGKPSHQCSKKSAHAADHEMAQATA
ncbi:hypothetical protein KSP40_PGU008226 [Platanthera guangdongensis]|uniref:Uncharacterized protein n=1 Tax=Platanthera guangdongensis TaxID=2320717 RepID=A0ABR2M4S6_9ASPA